MRKAQVASGELLAGIDGSGDSGGVAYEVRGYKQGWPDKRVGRQASRQPNRAKIVHSMILARKNNKS